MMASGSSERHHHPPRRYATGLWAQANLSPPVAAPLSFNLTWQFYFCFPKRNYVSPQTCLRSQNKQFKAAIISAVTQQNSANVDLGNAGACALHAVIITPTPHE